LIAPAFHRHNQQTLDKETRRIEMSKRIVVVVVAVLFLALLGSLAGGKLLGAGDRVVPEAAGPGLEGAEDSAEGQEDAALLGMPAPGFEGVPEMIVGGEEDAGAVSSGMPVPGFEDVPEMIVVEE
jgi:hypothetical protein